MGKVELRPYQVDVIDRLRSTAAKYKRPLLVAPTGAGKTVIASAVVASAVDKGSRVLFLAHRRELIQQAGAKLWSYGIDPGVILSGHSGRPEAQVQVASVQTLWARAFRSNAIDLPPADLIVLDEAHHVRSRTYRKILEAYPDAVVLGLTATPCRGDGRGLGNVFDAMVECPSVADLVKLGFLVPTKVYAPSTPDLAGVQTQRGDYVEKQLAERVDTPQLVGDIPDHWHRLAEGRQTVVFATGVEHSVHIRDAFRASGVWAEHIDGSTPVEERERILRQLGEGKVQVVTNCAVLTEGWDQPSVSCLILARPTRNMGLFRQMAGRVLRPAPGKDHALILDHAGAVFQHGFPEDPVRWTLAADKRAESAQQGAGGYGNERRLTTCPECHAVRMAGRPCTACGWRPRPRGAAVDVADGELAHVDQDGTAKAPEYDQASFYRQLLGIAEEKGYRRGWASHKFKEKFGKWPPFRYTRAEVPSPAVRSWVRSRQIAYAKAMEKARV